MDDLTRREALTFVAAAGATALGTVQDKKNSSPPPLKPGPQDKPKTMSDDETRADRQNVIAAGMTEAEADCWEQIAKCAGMFFGLPKLHPMDDHEISHAFHILQYRLLGRPTYRKYLEQAKGEKK